MLTIATDGSCHPNPGPGGWAWVDEDGRFAAGSFVQGTNNIGELEAIRHALLDHPNESNEIQYDSEYAVNCVTVWGPTWRRRGIMHEKKNHELISALMDELDARLYRGLSTKFTKVKGHSGHSLNEAVDHVAGLMMRRRRISDASGVIEIDTLTVTFD